MDVLSTMSNISGYRGVIEAAESYGGMFSGQVTAAGKTQPATVLIIGAGVGALLGNQLNLGGSATVRTIIGGAGGALIGRAIDRGSVRCN